jgi:hypothetical protein
VRRTWAARFQAHPPAHALPVDPTNISILLLAAGFHLNPAKLQWLLAHFPPNEK